MRVAFGIVYNLYFSNKQRLGCVPVFRSTNVNIWILELEDGAPWHPHPPRLCLILDMKKYSLQNTSFKLILCSLMQWYMIFLELFQCQFSYKVERKDYKWVYCSCKSFTTFWDLYLNFRYDLEFRNYPLVIQIVGINEAKDNFIFLK